MRTWGRTGKAASRPAAGRAGVCLVLVLALSVPAYVYADDEDTELRRLADQVARGDEVEAAAAAEQLIERVIGPLAEALGSFDARPVAEQVRLRRLMSRLAGELRLRVFRIDLPPEDRKLFEAFAAAYPELVRRLFHDNYAVRMAAVLRIPLEPNTGAGVLIAAKVNDEDEDVAKAALGAAAKLRDKVVARNLVRYIRDATAVVAAGFYGPEQQDVARTVALFVWESAKVVADVRATEAVSALVEALRFFGRSRYWDHYQRAELMRVLGRLGDERAATVLLDFLDDPARLRVQTGQGGRRVSETVGDVALLSLLRIYGLSPQAFELLGPSADEDFAGFADDESRREGHRAFRIWHEQHAGQPSTQPRPPASRPASGRTK